MKIITAIPIYTIGCAVSFRTCVNPLIFATLFQNAIEEIGDGFYCLSKSYARKSRVKRSKR